MTLANSRKKIYSKDTSKMTFVTKDGINLTKL